MGDLRDFGPKRKKNKTWETPVIYSRHFNLLMSDTWFSDHGEEASILCTKGEKSILICLSRLLAVCIVRVKWLVQIRRDVWALLLKISHWDQRQFLFRAFGLMWIAVKIVIFSCGRRKKGRRTAAQSWTSFESPFSLSHPLFEQFLCRKKRRTGQREICPAWTSLDFILPFLPSFQALFDLTFSTPFLFLRHTKLCMS